MLSAVILIPFYPADTPLRTLLELFILWPIMHVCMAGILLHVVQTAYRILNAAPIVWLGKISYSLYLWQQPFFSPPFGQPLYKLLFGLGLAYLSYYLIEQPILRLRERRAVVVPAKIV
jgi:peptidoglycan/LPS O-acetylase OafA/YrhL